MSTWRRIFGIDPVEFVLQGVITGVLLFWVTQANSHQDAVIIGSGLTVVSLVVLGVRRQLALRRAGRDGTGELESARVAELEQRVAELELDSARLTELEERLDFAERLLAQKEPARELLP